MFSFNSSCLLHVSNIVCSSSGRPFVHAVRYGMFVAHLCKQSSRWKDVLDTRVSATAALSAVHRMYRLCGYLWLAYLERSLRGFKTVLMLYRFSIRLNLSENTWKKPRNKCVFWSHMARCLFLMWRAFLVSVNVSGIDITLEQSSKQSTLLRPHSW